MSKDLNLNKIADGYTEIVGRALHEYSKDLPRIRPLSPTTAQDWRGKEHAWIYAYQADSVFNAQVKSVVAVLMMHLVEVIDND